MGFKKGQSGNPAGRPKGAKDKRTELRDLLKPHAPDLIKKLVELALSGDASALKCCLDKLVPSVRARDESVLVNLQGDLTEKGNQLLAELSAGNISPSEASQIMNTLTGQSRLSIADDLERRIEKLEDTANGRH